MPASANFRSCQVSMKNPRTSPNTWGSTKNTPLIGVVTNFIDAAPSRLSALFHDANQVFPISSLGKRLRQRQDLFCLDESLSPSDLLYARHLEALPFLDDAHERARIQERVVRAGIEPCSAPAEPLDLQSAFSEIHPIEIRDLQLPARRRL